MNKALVVAKWEFVCTVTRVPFIIAVIAMPLFYGGMFTLAGFAGRNVAQNSARMPAALVDRAQIVDLAFAAERVAERDRSRDTTAEDLARAMTSRSPAGSAVTQAVLSGNTQLKQVDDLDAGLAALRRREVSAVFVIEPDYLQTGALTIYGRDNGIFSQNAERSRQGQIADVIRASLLKPLDANTRDRAFGPVSRVKRMQLADDGTFTDVPNDGGLGMIAGSFGVFLLLTMSIFMSAGFLQQATLADRTNRVIEILISSVDPGDLVLGKLIGLAGAGLLQVGIYIALIIIPGAAIFSIIQVSATKLALSLVFTVIGYLVFAVLMTGTGMLGRTAQEGAQFSAIWILMASLPWFFFVNISAAPNGVLARVLSFFPLTTAITMMMRISATDLPPLEIAAVLVVDVLAIFLIFRASSRVFRAAALMYGKRPTLPEIVRWIRAA